METIKNDHKIILACSKQGIVNQLFLDTGSLLENIKMPVGLHSLVSPLSIQELSSFWLSIQEKSMEENTVLTLSYNDKEINYIFSGYLLQETVLLCGNTELTSTEKALEEIMLINNEQANQIRLSEKRVNTFLKGDQQKELNEAFLNDFTSLNNELINNKRELMLKNQKIELLNKELNAVNEHMTMYTYSVSHDLKEPLRMVRSFLTLFHKKYGKSLDEKGKSYIDLAMDGANRLNKMLAGLLDYHQSSDFDTSETVDLNEVFLEVKKILQKEIKEKKAKITSEKLPIIKGSTTGYLQVFQNLISNAIKFVPEGKTPVVSIHVEKNDATYTIMVKDNGIGIPENQVQEVFSLFKRLNSEEQYEGTGVGLAMVKKNIERLGGEIWLESEEGKGSTFYFTIH
ncbi:sensor histidine kinase [Pleomorphovibrio marinus]|uniref:sensor histidine kinase n=1 Tax=Pleomorphovibrio marinus TaxID=2164132 RepID=UPI000E0A2419|nr:ATP-binding protein [Pleomorphovibrio marinus]